MKVFSRQLFFFGLDAKYSLFFQFFNSVGCCVDGCKIVEFWVDVALLNQLCVVCFNFFVAGFFIVAWPTDLFQR